MASLDDVFFSQILLNFCEFPLQQTHYMWTPSTEMTLEGFDHWVIDPPLTFKSIQSVQSEFSSYYFKTINRSALDPLGNYKIKYLHSHLGRKMKLRKSTIWTLKQLMDFYNSVFSWNSKIILFWIYFFLRGHIIFSSWKTHCITSKNLALFIGCQVSSSSYGY